MVHQFSQQFPGYGVFTMRFFPPYEFRTTKVRQKQTSPTCLSYFVISLHFGSKMSKRKQSVSPSSSRKRRHPSSPSTSTLQSAFALLELQENIESASTPSNSSVGLSQIQSSLACLQHSNRSQ